MYRFIFIFTSYKKRKYLLGICFNLKVFLHQLQIRCKKFICGKFICTLMLQRKVKCLGHREKNPLCEDHHKQGNGNKIINRDKKKRKE